MQTSIEKQHEQMLLLLALTDADRNLLAALLEVFFKVEKDHLRFLRGPVVQQKSPWQDTTPPWLYKAIVPERIGIVIDEHRRGVVESVVGPAELVAALYPATMDAPARYQPAQVYLWASANAVAARDGKMVADVWKQLGLKPILDAQIIEPDGEFYNEYSELCAVIRRRVVTVQTERDRASKRSKPEDVDPPQTVQASLF